MSVRRYTCALSKSRLAQLDFREVAFSNSAADNIFIIPNVNVAEYSRFSCNFYLILR